MSLVLALLPMGLFLIGSALSLAYGYLYFRKAEYEYPGTWCLVSWVSLLSLFMVTLTILGCFNLFAVIGFIWMLTVWGFIRMGTISLPRSFAWSFPSKYHAALWGVMLLGGVFFLRPHDLVLGNWDPGVYVAQGYAIHYRGGLVFEDTAAPFLENRNDGQVYLPKARSLFNKHPGTYAKPDDTLLYPQFFPLVQTWVALFVGVFPNEWAMYVICLFMWGSLWLLMQCGSLLFGRTIAPLLGLLFVLHPVPVYFSGFFTGEVAFLFFILGLFFLFLQDQNSRMTRIIQTLTLFSMMFTTVMVLLMACLLFLIDFYFSALRKDRLFHGPSLCIGIGLFSLFCYRVAGPYLQTVLGISSFLLSPLTITLLVGLFLTPWLLRYLKSDGFVHFQERYMPWFYIISLFVLAWWLYPIYPWLILQVYLFPVYCWALILFGLFIVGRNLSSRTLLIWLALIAYTAFFSRYNLMSNNYPWTYKRSLPVNIPVYLFCIGFCLRVLLIKISARWIWWIFLPFLAYYANDQWHKSPYAFPRSWPGLTKQLHRVNGDIPVPALILAPYELATPLEFIFNRTILPYNGKIISTQSPPYQKALTVASEQGLPIFLVSQPKDSLRIEVPHKHIATYKLDTEMLFMNPLPPMRAPEKVRQVIHVRQLLPE